MLLKIAVENGIDHRSIAWALDFPGCTADGPDGGTAIVSMPQAFLKYCDWIGRHTADSWLEDVGDFDVRLVETQQACFVNQNLDVVEETNPHAVEIDSFFRHDWKPLSADEIRRGLLLFGWSREDLLAAVNGLTPAELDAARTGERWSIRGILGHVACAEWWYLDRLGLTGGQPFSSLPPDPLEQLAIERARLEQVFPGMAGSRQVVGMDGELWSPRKLLRYALWHERITCATSISCASGNLPAGLLSIRMSFAGRNIPPGITSQAHRTTLLHRKRPQKSGRFHRDTKSVAVCR